jgi:hypothetical protein
MKMFTGRRKWQDIDQPWFKRHSLSIVLAALMACQTLIAVWSGVFVWDREQPLGDGLASFGAEFWMWWIWEYNISLVADTFGVLLIVVLSKWLYEVGSSESNSGS